MRPAFVVPIAYAATVLAVPILFWGLTQFWKVPLPLGLMMASPVKVYLVTAMFALIAGVPGFVLGRLGLWWFGMNAPLSFAVVGGLAGYLAAVALALPGDLWALRFYSIDIIGLMVGAVAGLLYRKLEFVFLAGPPIVRNSVESGALGK